MCEVLDVHRSTFKYWQQRDKRPSPEVIRLRSLVRDDVARELTYTARIFDADEAKEMGLVTKLSETPYDDAMEMASYIAGRNPDAITAAKRLLNNAHDLTAAEVLLEESREQDKIIGSANQMEAVMAELEKRPAKFG